MIKFIKIIKIISPLNLKDIFFELIKGLFSSYLVYVLYLILSTKSLTQTKNILLSILILDLVLKRLLTRSRITSLNTFLYLQIKKKTLFIYFLLDSIFSISNLFILLTAFIIIFSKEFYSYEYFKVLTLLFFFNTLMERAIRIIKKSTFLFIFFISIIYFITLYFSQILNIKIIIIILFLIMILLYKSFKKFIYFKWPSI